MVAEIPSKSHAATTNRHKKKGGGGVNAASHYASLVRRNRNPFSS
jgi:hypothetical protein